MSLLKQFSKDLLIGSERRPPELPSATGDLAILLGQINADETPVETRALRTAGVLAIYEAAGYLPTPTTAIVPACAAEQRQFIEAPTVIDCLHEILRDGPRLLIRQTLIALAQTNYLLPAKLLPGFISLGKDYPNIQPLLVDVSGERGRWLAQFNPEWNFLLHYNKPLDQQAAEKQNTSNDHHWDLLTFSERLIYIGQLRQQQSDQARELIASALGEMDARERVGLLEKLRLCLTLQDEDFLNQQLTDRSKEVRRLAADLLGELPASNFVQRATTRLSLLLTLERKLVRKHWQLDAPQKFDAEWSDDTLEEKRPQAETLGDRAWWLYQLVRFAPLGWWEETTGMNPVELLNWSAGTDWHLALTRAWHQRIIKEKHGIWAEALLSAKPIKGFQFDPLELLAYLTPERSESYWLELLNSDSAKNRRGEFIGRILAQSDNAISCAFAQAIFKSVKKNITDDASKWDYPLRQSIVDLASIIPQQCFSEATQGWPIDNNKIDFFSETIANIIRVIQQRNTLNQFFSE